MAPYVAILVRGDGEARRAYLPDFGGCRADGESPKAALERAKALARKSVSGSIIEASKPRGLMEIRDDPTWARDRGIDWHDAIVVMVEI